MNLTLQSVALYSIQSSPFFAKSQSSFIFSTRFMSFMYSHSFHSFYYSRSQQYPVLFHQMKFNRFLTSPVFIESQNFADSSFSQTLRLFNAGNVELSRCIFRNCVSGEALIGGGLHITGTNCVISISFCSFINCESKGINKSKGIGGGCAILPHSGKTTILSCCFLECSSSTSGLAIYFYDDHSILEVNNVLAQDCPKFSATVGYTIYLTAALFVSNLNVTNCKATQYPGFNMQFAGHRAELTYLTLSQNTIRNELYRMCQSNETRTSGEFHHWNILNTSKDSRNRLSLGVYENLIIEHSYVIFMNNQINTSMDVMNDLVVFINCISDRPYEKNTDSNESALVWGDNCLISNHANTYVGSSAVYACPIVTIKKGFRYEFFLYLLIVLIVIGWVSYKKLNDERLKRIDSDVIGDNDSLLNKNGAHLIQM